MEESIKPGQKPLVQGLSKEDFIKLSSLINEGTVRVPKQIGAIFSLGIFIVAMVSVLIAANSFFNRSTNTRIDKVETELKGTNARIDKIETELKETNARIDKIETELKEIKKNVALILERLPKKN